MTINTHHINARSDFAVNPRKLTQYHEALRNGIATMDAESLARAGFGAAKTATMDAQTAMQTDFNMPVSNQFLQHWLPGNIRVFTAPRRAEELMGFVQAGAFETETIVARFGEMTGYVDNYGDLADVNRSGYNIEYATRGVVRFQGGIQSDRLEAARASAIGVNDLEEKRASLGRAFAIMENYVSFNGYAGVRCFGLFNDPNLEAYQTLAPGASAQTAWSSKTTAEKQKDIKAAVTYLAQKSKTAFDPLKDAFTWAVTPAVHFDLVDNVAVGGTAIAQTVREWVEKSYPGIRIVVIPEFAGANGGADVWYMYKESTVDVDNSTDDGSTLINMIQNRMFMLSALPTRSGGSEEAYASAQAGVFVKRPILIVRYTGM